MTEATTRWLTEGKKFTQILEALRTEMSESLNRASRLMPHSPLDTWRLERWFKDALRKFPPCASRDGMEVSFLLPVLGFELDELVAGLKEPLNFVNIGTQKAEARHLVHFLPEGFYRSLVEPETRLKNRIVRVTLWPLHCEKGTPNLLLEEVLAFSLFRRTIAEQITIASTSTSSLDKPTYPEWIILSNEISYEFNFRGRTISEGNLCQFALGPNGQANLKGLTRSHMSACNTPRYVGWCYASGHATTIA